jgi:Recombinase
LVDKWYSPNEIATALNKEGIKTATGKDWDREKIVRVLTNESYLGSRVYNKTWGRLKQKKRTNPREEWVVTANAFEAVVDANQFRKAQENLYWLMPSKWKRGIYKTNKLQKFMRDQLLSLLEKHRDYDIDTIRKLVSNFPFLFGITLYKEGLSHWCFRINEDAKRFNYIVGVGIDMYSQDLTPEFFTIPTDVFGIGSFVCFSEKEDLYSTCRIDHEDIENKILAISETVKLF